VTRAQLHKVSRALKRSLRHETESHAGRLPSCKLSRLHPEDGEIIFLRSGQEVRLSRNRPSRPIGL
jgi:hypothetical protein